MLQVSKPLGLYANAKVSAPCGLCSADGIIGLLDMPDTFFDPGRVKAGILWFTGGYVEYQFPGNVGGSAGAMEFSMEVSSGSPGTSRDWPSEISLSVNETKIGTSTLRADCGGGRGMAMPDWRSPGATSGKLTTWRVTRSGTYIDGMRVSAVSLSDLDIDAAKPIRLRIGVASDDTHPGGLSIFGKGFGRHNQEIVMRFGPKH